MEPLPQICSDTSTVSVTRQLQSLDLKVCTQVDLLLFDPQSSLAVKVTVAIAPPSQTVEPIIKCRYIYIPITLNCLANSYCLYNGRRIVSNCKGGTCCIG